MLLPAQDAFALFMHVVCDTCGSEADGIIALPAQRRSFAAVEQLATTGAPCPSGEPCDGQSEIQQLVYAFDEEGVAPLKLDTASGVFTIDGVEVHSEDDVVELIGRPFSVADRLLQIISQPYGLHELCPGVFVMACTNDDEASRLVAELVSRLRDDDEIPALPCAFNWAEDNNVSAWLGPYADDVREGRRRALTVVLPDEAVAALRQAAVHHEGLTVSDIRDEPESPVCDVRRGRMQATPSIATMSFTVTTQAVTLREAAALTIERTADTFDALEDALSRIEAQTPHLLDGWEVRPGPVLLNESRGIDLLAMAFELHNDAEALTVRISERLAPANHGTLPCGCEGTLCPLLRPAGAAHLDNVMQQPVSGSDTTVVVLAIDCPHHTGYLFEHPTASEDELWAQARRALNDMVFDLWERPVHDIDGRPVGAVLVGPNASSVALDGRLARSAAAQLQIACGRLAVITLTAGVVVIGDHAQADLLRHELAFTARSLRTNRYVQELPMEYETVFTGSGATVGTFDFNDMPAHQLEQAAREAGWTGNTD